MTRLEKGQRLLALLALTTAGGVQAQTASSPPPASLPTRPGLLLVGSPAPKPQPQQATTTPLAVSTKHKLELGDRSLTLRLPFGRAAQGPFELVDAKDPSTTSVQLVLDGVFASGAASSGSYSIYLNLPSAAAVAAAKSASDLAIEAHYVGSIGLAELARGRKVTKAFEIGKLVPALKASGDWNAEEVEVHFVKDDAVSPSESRVRVNKVRLTAARE